MFFIILYLILNYLKNKNFLTNFIINTNQIFVCFLICFKFINNNFTLYLYKIIILYFNINFIT